MGKMQFGVYSTVRGKLGNSEPVKKYETRSQDKESVNSTIEPLFPAGVEISGQRNIQDNSGIEPLLPAGVLHNTTSVLDIRSQLGEAVRLQFMGEMQMFDILDSEKFTYGKFESDGSKKVYETSYKISDSGILNVSWTSARSIQDNQSNELTALQDFADRNMILLPSDLNANHKKY